MYKIYKDKDRLFKCTVDVQGANLEDCYARLVFEYKDQETIMYKGTIDKNGVCKILIPKIKKFNEGDSGSVILEVIAENTLFESWKSNFEVSFDKKVNVVMEDTENQLQKKDESKDIDHINNKKVSIIMEDTEDEVVKSDRNITKDFTKDTKHLNTVSDSPIEELNSNELGSNELDSNIIEDELYSEPEVIDKGILEDKEVKNTQKNINNKDNSKRKYINSKYIEEDVLDFESFFSKK